MNWWTFDKKKKINLPRRNCFQISSVALPYQIDLCNLDLYWIRPATNPIIQMLHRRKEITDDMLECCRSYSRRKAQHSPGHHLTGEGCYMHGSCSGCLLHRSVCRCSILPTDPSCRSQLQQSQDKLVKMKQHSPQSDYFKRFLWRVA